MWFLFQLVCMKQDPKESDILCLAHMPLTVSLLIQEFLSSPSFLFPSNSFLEETRSGHWHSTSPWILIHLSVFSISYLLCFLYTRNWSLSKSSFNSFGENTSQGWWWGVGVVGCACIASHSCLGLFLCDAKTDEWFQVLSA